MENPSEPTAPEAEAVAADVEASAPDAPSVVPGAEAVHHEGGEHAILLCHGFTGAPTALTGWAEHLAEAGFTVDIPLLPGHGTNWQDLATTRWTDWYDGVDEAYDRLEKAGHRISVAGLSMGGALALRLAAKHDVSSIVLVNPAVATRDRFHKAAGVFQHVVKSIRVHGPRVGSGVADPAVPAEPHADMYDHVPVASAAELLSLWAHVRADLPDVTAPLLLFRSRIDATVDNSSETAIFHGVGSRDVTMRLLPDSWHVATRDLDSPMIFAESTEFFRRH